MPPNLMSLKVLLPFQVFAEKTDVLRIVAETRVGSFGLALPFMLAGLGLWAADWLSPKQQAEAWRASLLVVFIVAFSLIHLLSWALNRYRLPVDAVGLLFAGRAVIALGRRIAPRHQPARLAVGT